MPPTPFTKTFAPHMAALVRQVCHYQLKYSAQLQATFLSVVTDPADRAVITTFIASLTAACNVFNKYWPA